MSTRYSSERLRAVRIIESMRSGIPTRYSTRELPDLRPELINTIRSDLKLFKEGELLPGRLIWGQYGQGKSHLLISAEHVALDMGFAVSYVTLSREVTCHNLLPFYQRLAPIVRTPHSNVPGIQIQLSRRKPEELDESPISTPERYGHQMPAVVLELLLHYGADGEEFYNLYNDLMGYRLQMRDLRYMAARVGLAHKLQGLPRFRKNDARAYFGVLADTLKWCGFHGWVILIDEIELLARLGKASRLQAYQNLNWLFNWSEEMAYPIYVIGAAASSLQEAWYSHYGRRPPDRVTIADMAREKFGRDEEGKMQRFFEFAVEDYNKTILPITKTAVLPLLEKLVILHAEAYDWHPPLTPESLGKIIDKLPDDTRLRTYIRYILEILDQLMNTGEIPGIEVKQMIEPPIELEEEEHSGNSSWGE